MSLKPTDESACHHVTQKDFDNLNAVIQMVETEYKLKYIEVARHGYACVYYPRGICLRCHSGRFSVTRNSWSYPVTNVAEAAWAVGQLYKSDHFMRQ